MDNVMSALHYPFNWIRFLEINKLYNIITKKLIFSYFQQIKNWFKLIENFKHVQTFELLLSA